MQLRRKVAFDKPSASAIWCMELACLLGLRTLPNLVFNWGRGRGLRWGGDGAPLIARERELVPTTERAEPPHLPLPHLHHALPHTRHTKSRCCGGLALFAQTRAHALSSLWRGGDTSRWAGPAGALAPAAARLAAACVVADKPAKGARVVPGGRCLCGPALLRPGSFRPPSHPVASLRPPRVMRALVRRCSRTIHHGRRCS